MKSPLILLLIFVIFCRTAAGQTGAKITDVDFYFQNNQLVITYNLEGSLPDYLFTISLKFINESNQEIVPKTIMGDAGKNISGNGKKIIIWDVSKDLPELNGILRASVTITEVNITYKGPKYALLSVLIPGLGGYFTDDNKTRAIITTVSVVGLMAYGITQKTQADKYYKDYKASDKYDEIQTLYNKANSANNKYFIATRTGTLIWVADIVWVALKGSKNKKEARSFNSKLTGDGLRLNYVNNRVLLGYQVTF